MIESLESLKSRYGNDELINFLYGKLCSIQDVISDETYLQNSMKKTQTIQNTDVINKNKPSLDEIRFGKVECCGNCKDCRYRNNTVCLIEKRLGSDKPTTPQIKYAEKIARFLNIGLPICKRKESYKMFIAINENSFCQKDYW